MLGDLELPFEAPYPRAMLLTDCFVQTIEFGFETIETLVHFCKALVDPIEALIYILKSLVDLIESFLDHLCEVVDRDSRRLCGVLCLTHMQF